MYYAVILNSIANEKEKDYIVFKADSLSKAEEEAKEYLFEFIENTPNIWEILEKAIKEECEYEGILYESGDSREYAIRDIIYKEDGYYDLFELNSNKIHSVNIDELSSSFKHYTKEFLKTYAIYICRTYPGV